MLVRIKSAIIGGARLTVSSKDAPRVLSLCLEMMAPCSRAEATGDRTVIETSCKAARRLARKLEYEGIDFEEKHHGFPFFLWAYRKRPGIFAGFILALAVILLSGRVVWDIRISGNRVLDSAAVKKELEAVGFGLGSSVKTDVDKVANSLLVRSDKISWLSVNMSGTVAYVQLREEASPAEKDSSPCNLVAASDGTVERIEATSGTVCVEVGQSVQKGEILVSGVRGGTLGNYTLEKAAGAVYAITRREISVEVPLEYEREVPVSVKKGEKYIKFFSKNIFFSRNSGNSTLKCVKIYREENLSPPFLPPLPFGVVTEIVTEYKSEVAKRNEKEASDMAFRLLGLRLTEELCNADLMSKTIRCHIGDSSVRLVCEAVCSENIALPQKIHQ